MGRIEGLIKYIFGGIRNVLKVRMTVFAGLQTYLKSEW